MAPRIRVAIAAVAACGALFALAAGTTWSAQAGVSVALGATLAASNLWVLARIVGAVARPDRPNRALVWRVVAIGKVLWLFALVWLLIAWGVARPFPLGLGYTTLAVGIAIGSVVSDRAERRTDGAARPDSTRPR